MQYNSIVWLTLFVVMSYLSFRRPACGVGVYMLSYFACPQFWWWGKNDLSGYRWNMYGGWILLAAVIVGKLMRPNQERFKNEPQLVKWITFLAIGILINATLVHLVLAPNRNISALAFDHLYKFVLLFFLLIGATRNVMDFRIVLLSILLGAGYIGYEATINHRGKFHANRLEGVGAPGAASANELANLMVTVMPMAGVFLLSNRRWEKLVTLPIGGFLINVVLLCNSRGAFLACIGSGIAFLATVPSRERSKGIGIVVLGSIGAFLLMGDERIIARFMTTFAGEEERDHSAASRLDYWKAGLRMIADHPLGAGGHGFSRVYGPNYIRDVSGAEFNARSVHNGYINEACEWGIQGGIMRLLFIACSMALMFQTSRRCSQNGDAMGSILGAAFISGTIAFMIASFFGDFIDSEWGYWMSALAVAYGRFYAENPGVAAVADAYAVPEIALEPYYGQIVRNDPLAPRGPARLRGTV